MAQLTKVYYPQILKADNKWYYAPMCSFFLSFEGAIAAARISAYNRKGVKDVRVIERMVELDEEGHIKS